MFDIEWVNGNIVNVPAEAIVCPTSPGFSKAGPGVEAAVYKASREELKNEREEIFKTLCAKEAHLKAGDVYVTKSYFTKNKGNSVTKYILHVVGTSARKKCLADVFDVYAQCYANILAHTVDYHCSTVAIPILGSRGSRMEYMEAFKMEYAILSALNKAEYYHGIEKIYLTTFLMREEGNWGDVSKFLGMKEPRRHFGEPRISKEQCEFYEESNYTEEIYYDNVEMAIWDARKNAFLSSGRQNETIFSSVWNNLMHQREYEKRYTRAYIERVTDIPSTTYRRILNGEMNPTRNQVIVLSIVAGLAPHQTDKLLDTIKAAHLRPDDTQDKKFFEFYDKKIKKEEAILAFPVRVQKT